MGSRLRRSVEISVVAVAVALLLWLGASARDTEASATKPVSQPAPQPPDLSGLAAPKPDSTIDDAAAVPLIGAGDVPSAQQATPRGRLVVFVTWAATGAPAANVALVAQAYPDAHGTFGGLSGTTDAAGRWETEIASGELYVQADRGGAVSGQLRDGETTELNLAIPGGVLVRGIVLAPDRTPLPDADVRLCAFGAGNGFPAARAGADGRFEVRDVSGGDDFREHRTLCAFAPGFTPSARVPIEQDGTGVQNVSLRLGPPGGAIEGRVTDSAGAPIAGALIVVGSTTFGWLPPWKDGVRGELGPQQASMLSEVDGHYRLADLPADKDKAADIAVLAGGHSPWSGTVTIEAGQTAHVDVALPDSARVQGTVTDEAGAPVPGAQVSMGTFGGIRYDMVETDGGGHYLITDAPLSKPDDGAEIGAQKEGAGRASTRLVIEAGATVSWDPQLIVGPHIAGRVVDAKGFPLAGCSVTAISEGGRWFDTSAPQFEPVRAMTDAMGRFDLLDCEKGASTLYVHGPGSSRTTIATVKGVRPGPREVVVRVGGSTEASAFVTGRLVAPPGIAFEHERVALHGDAGNTWAQRIELDGSFRIGPVLSGRYDVSASADGLPDLIVAAFDVPAGDTIDLGNLVFAEPRFIEAHLILPEGVDPADANARVDHDGWESGLGMAAITEDATRRRSMALAPGDYRVFANGKYLLPATVPVHVEADRDATVEVTLQACGTAVVTVHSSSHEPAPGCVRLLRSDRTPVETKDIEWLHLTDYELTPDEKEASFDLVYFDVLAGSYTAQVLRADKVVQEGSVDVETGGQGRVEFTLE